MQITEALSPNHDARPVPPDMIVLHYTGMQSGEEALARLRAPESRVSSHYLIEEDGRVLRLVKDNRRAWHAGISYWAGRDNLNDVSIGIEIVNPGHEWGYRAYPKEQLASVFELVAALRAEHGIAAPRVVGHSDIAPTRKEDPGELFPWRRLAAAGHSIWTAEADEKEDGRFLDPAGLAELADTLHRIGYDTRAFPAALKAFRRRFRPEALEGAPVMRDFLIARGVLSASGPLLSPSDAPITSGEFSRPV